MFARDKATRIALGESRASSGDRTLDERLYVRFPWLLHRTLSGLSRLRVGSRLRRVLLARLLYRGWAASDRGDLELTLSSYDPDVVIRWPAEGFAAFPDLKGEYRGHDGFRRVWETLHEPWDVDVAPEEVIDAGDRMLVVGHITARGKGSGLAADSPMFVLFRNRNGRIVSEEWFDTRAEAMEAAGLPM